MGVPTVPIQGKVFYGLGKMYAGLVGMPNHRFVITPFPISQISREVCREYALGADPITGKPIVDEIFEALTMPLSPEDRRSGSEERPEPRLLAPDTEDNLHRIFKRNEWTDYLPIVLPTEERVEAMMKGTSHAPNEVVGELRSGYEACTFTVEQVAANAVMAGAEPEYMPVILALAASGVPAIATSTQSFGRMIVINGPIRNEIGMNMGMGALSPMNQASAVIARAATLISLNLGAGGIPNKSYFGSQGNVTNFSHVTFGENEEELPEGWKPLHVQVGFEPNESAISFFHGYSISHWKNTFELVKAEAVLNAARRILPSGAYKSGLALILDPIVADDFVREGFTTKEALSEYVYKNTLLSLDEFWRYDLIEGITLPAAQKGVEPYATWLKTPRGTMVTRYRDPKEISVLVVGGRTNHFWQYGDYHLIGSFSIDEWR
jgi:hypothetical protein